MAVETTGLAGCDTVVAVGVVVAATRDRLAQLWNLSHTRSWNLP